MDLSIIIINFNTSKLTIQSIESIYKHTKNISFEILLVDNASEKGDLKKIHAFAEGRKEITIIESNTNLGFAGGNNLGLKRAKGEHILLLNSDTQFTSNVTQDLLSWMKDKPEIGIVSVALRNPDGSVQRNGGYFPNLFRVALWMWFIEDLPIIGSTLKTFHPMPSKHSRAQDWVTGAFMLISHKAFKDVGMMSEDYFMYTEDVDYCYEFSKKGYKTWYLPQFSIIHLGGASGKFGDSLIKEFTSLKIFYKKHYPGWQMPLLRMFLWSGSFVRMVLFGILKGREAQQLYAKIIREV